jgi:pimeloyl-ACP methyl ester carboxylesterase
MYKSIAFLAAVIALSISTAIADSFSDRITVTVRGHGPDVILIPGLTCSSAVWDATAAHLQAHYRLHLIQINGFAGAPSLANAQGPVVQPTLDAINAYIKAKKLKLPYIIGHSLGGTMGMMLALQHPEDVGSLMVVDALPFAGMLFGANDVAAATSQATMMRDSIISESPGAFAAGEKYILRSMVKSPEGLNAATGWAVASDKSVVARALYEDMTTDLRPKLSEIKTPVTILYPWDSSSSYSKPDTDGFYQQNFAALPNKKMVRIDGSYHFIMLDQPAAFWAQVDQFLK